MFQHTTSGQLIECYWCLSPKLIKHGSTSGFAQRYKCQDCGKSFSVGGRPKYSDYEKRNILLRVKELGIRRVARTLHIAPATIKKRWIIASKEDTTKKFIEYNLPIDYASHKDEEQIMIKKDISCGIEYRRIPVY